MSTYEDREWDAHNDAGYAHDEAESLTDALNDALFNSDWCDLIHVRVIAGGGDSFGFEAYIADPHMESDPTYEAHGYTSDDAWGIVRGLETLFKGRLIPDDVRGAIGAVE